MEHTLTDDKLDAPTDATPQTEACKSAARALVNFPAQEHSHIFQRKSATTFSSARVTPNIPVEEFR